MVLGKMQFASTGLACPLYLRTLVLHWLCSYLADGEDHADNGLVTDFVTEKVDSGIHHYLCEHRENGNGHSFVRYFFDCGSDKIDDICSSVKTKMVALAAENFKYNPPPDKMSKLQLNCDLYSKTKCKELDSARHRIMDDLFSLDRVNCQLAFLDCAVKCTSFEQSWAQGIRVDFDRLRKAGKRMTLDRLGDREMFMKLLDDSMTKWEMLEAECRKLFFEGHTPPDRAVDLIAKAEGEVQKAQKATRTAMLDLLFFRQAWSSMSSVSEDLYSQISEENMEYIRKVGSDSDAASCYTSIAELCSDLTPSVCKDMWKRLGFFLEKNVYVAVDRAISADSKRMALHDADSKLMSYFSVKKMMESFDESVRSRVEKYEKDPWVRRLAPVEEMAATLYVKQEIEKGRLVEDLSLETKPSYPALGYVCHMHFKQGKEAVQFDLEKMYMETKAHHIWTMQSFRERPHMVEFKGYHDCADRLEEALKKQAALYPSFEEASMRHVEAARQHLEAYRILNDNIMGFRDLQDDHRQEMHSESQKDDKNEEKIGKLQADIEKISRVLCKINGEVKTMEKTFPGLKLAHLLDACEGRVTRTDLRFMSPEPSEDKKMDTDSDSDSEEGDDDFHDDMGGAGGSMDKPGDGSNDSNGSNQNDSNGSNQNDSNGSNQNDSNGSNQNDSNGSNGSNQNDSNDSNGSNQNDSNGSNGSNQHGRDSSNHDSGLNDAMNVTPITEIVARTPTTPCTELMQSTPLMTSRNVCPRTCSDSTAGSASRAASEFWAGRFRALSPLNLSVGASSESACAVKDDFGFPANVNSDVFSAEAKVELSGFLADLDQHCRRFPANEGALRSLYDICAH